MTRTLAQTVDIGHGRGRLAPEPAASIARIDAQLDRPADVNSAWRSPTVQQKAYDAWVAYSRYLAGGPWAPKAPRALPPSESVHCDGEAADSDDWYNAQAAAVWRDNGWRQTARTSNPITDEPWHGEHFVHLDNHRNDPTGGETPPEPPEEEDDMYKPTVHLRTEGSPEWTLGHPDIGQDLDQYTGPGSGGTRKSGDGKVTFYRGFAATADATVGKAWARTHAKGDGGETSRTDRAGYIAIQVELSRVSGELTG